MLSEDIVHKQDLIRIYRRRLHVLEKQHALQGYHAPPATITEIQEIKTFITDVSKELTELSQSRLGISAYRLEYLSSPLQEYDPIFQRLAEALPQIGPFNEPFETSILKSLAFAFQAQAVFILPSPSLASEVKVKLSSSVEESLKLLDVEIDLRQAILQTINEKSIRKYDSNSSNTSLFVPFPERDPDRVLIILNIEIAFQPSIILEQALYTLLSITNNLKRKIPANIIESEINNSLKRTFGYVSHAMYKRQLELFRERLQTIEIHFEPMISLSKYQVYLWGWEALAREPGARYAPIELFKIAELWGTRFQVELDIHCLKTAVKSYGPNRRQRSNEVMPLFVNVYPISLLHNEYDETLQQIGRDRKIPLDILTLEISEKMPIPHLADSPESLSPMEIFVKRLRELKKSHIRFAIDDFGIGYSSSSRLSRIGPAFIKIDRDALLDPFGDLTIKYAVDVAESLPGHIGVVIEGFDRDSRIPLPHLVDLGVQYVQGHRVGEAVRFDAEANFEDLNRLSAKSWGELCNELGIATDKKR